MSPRFTLDPPLSRRTTSDENLPASMFRAEPVPSDSGSGSGSGGVSHGGMRDSQIPHVQHIRHLSGGGRLPSGSSVSHNTPKAGRVAGDRPVLSPQGDSLFVPPRDQYDDPENSNTPSESRSHGTSKPRNGSN